MNKKKLSNLVTENYLVCVDNSDEFATALNYACKIAKENKTGIILLYVIEAEKFRHWKGVESIMKKEQENDAKEILSSYLETIVLKYKIKTKTIIKRGEKIDILIKTLNNKRYKITNLILGLAMEETSSNKIIGSLTSGFRKKLTLPITIVPGNMEV